ncbi:hypothetical protein H8K52_15160 [Undibacterium seohonense]|uniref:Uncharacterized protein n=1 Tax=Undibacterium seohonense TaxID=1344950 RepID=A0ABR6X6U6_9BURK|nr:hypothetical protein [Undibacterium seohonense]
MTKQIVRKITELIQNVEQQFVQLLIEYSSGKVERSRMVGLLMGHK